MQREMRSNSLASQHAHIVSNSGNIGPLYPSPFGFHSDAPFSSVFPDESHNEGSSFLTQSMNAGVYLPSAAYFSFSGTLQVSANSFSKDSADMTWNSDLAQSILTYSDDIIITGDDEIESSLIVASDEYLNKQNAWSNAMNDNWNELLIDSSSTKSQAKSLLPHVYPVEQSHSCIQVRQPRNHQLVSCHSGEHSAVPGSLFSSTAATKPRMRWTLELHERFLDAVDQLGGSEKATPKGVLNIMKVEGLTICHVKSHLQKFRTAQCMSDSPGMPGKNIEREELPSLNLKKGIDLTEALRLQMEVQKQLHAQLEIQKKLQLQIEKQEKFLQMIVEKQWKPATVVHASSTVEESKADKTDYTKKSKQPREENGTNGSSVSEERKVGDKWRMPASEQLDSCGTNTIPDSPSPLKHARRNDDNDA